MFLGMNADGEITSAKPIAIDELGAQSVAITGTLEWIKDYCEERGVEHEELVEILPGVYETILSRKFAFKTESQKGEVE